MTTQQTFALAFQHHHSGRLAEAEALYRQILAAEPGHADAFHLLGAIAAQTGRNDLAVDLIRQAIALHPNYPDAHCNLGIALKNKGRLDDAIAAFREAIALNSTLPEAHSNLGNALKDKGQLDEAITAFRQAIALRPDLPEAHYNLGIALRDKGQMDESIASCRRAIALKPYLPEAHFHVALALLAQGDFIQGWEEYEWRWMLKDTAFRKRNFAQPRWDGRPLEGRTLLLHAEQGFGDAIQFIRYLPLIAACGGKIVVECPPELQRLFQTMAPDLPVAAKTELLPAFDVHCPLLSLPRVFSTDLGNLPQAVPYLYAEDADTAFWRERLAGLGSSLKVGLVWAGRPAHKNDRSRSLKLARLAPLAEVPGVRFISMQKDAATEARTLLTSLEWIDVADDLKDFRDTAALIANLDLIITVDTAVAHLAGALGKPVWTLLPFAPDWRWLLDRSDSPWYPTMRLFRQPAAGDWDAVIQSVKEELSAIANKGTPKPPSLPAPVV